MISVAVHLQRADKTVNEKDGNTCIIVVAWDPQCDSLNVIQRTCTSDIIVQYPQATRLGGLLMICNHSLPSSPQRSPFLMLLNCSDRRQTLDAVW